MLYSILLNLHSVLRWLVITALLFTFFLLFYKKFTNGILTKQNYHLLQIVCAMLNIQLFVGILLFSKSQLVWLFWDNIGETIKLRQPRFFGLEHPSMMIFGILLFNYFTFKIKKKINTSEAISYFLNRLFFILIIILSSIPWSFSPLTSRPNFR